MHAKVAIPILFLFLPFGHTFLPNKKKTYRNKRKKQKNIYIGISESRRSTTPLEDKD